MAEIGDKFIIEVEQVYDAEYGVPKLYRMKGFNSLVFDDVGLSKLQKYNELPKKSDIKIGDWVYAEDRTAKFIVTFISNYEVAGIDMMGRTYSYTWDQIDYPTGDHADWVDKEMIGVLPF